MAVDPELAYLAAQPLRDHKRINEIFLPQGKKAAKRRTSEERDHDLAEARAARVREKEEAAAKRSRLLDYYASTQTPFARIAEYLGMKDEDVAKAMVARGRHL